LHAEITITLWKISHITATKYHIVRIKCNKFDFRLQRSPNPLAVFKAPTSNERGREREEQESEGNGGGRKGERGGEEMEGRTGPRIQPPPWVLQMQNLGWYPVVPSDLQVI